MKYSEDARLDSSQIDNREGRSSSLGGPGGLGGLGSILGNLPRGGKAGAGGAGIIGIVLVIALNFLSNNPNAAKLLNFEGSEFAGETAEFTECKTGADANTKEQCALVADVNSIQKFWQSELPKLGTIYEPARTVLFTGSTSSACGTASTSTGPFYCPADKKVYLDRAFFGQFAQQFDAQIGTFAQAYVLAHEYGHHVTNLQGNLSLAQQDREGPSSGSVRVELQADCYAGVWAHNAVATGFVQSFTDADIAEGLDAAAKVGDDYIAKKTSGSVDPESFTHGSSEQRSRWFALGYKDGNARSCNTLTGAL